MASRSSVSWLGEKMTNGKGGPLISDSLNDITNHSAGYEKVSRPSSEVKVSISCSLSWASAPNGTSISASNITSENRLRRNMDGFLFNSCYATMIDDILIEK